MFDLNSEKCGFQAFSNFAQGELFFIVAVQVGSSRGCSEDCLIYDGYQIRAFVHDISSALAADDNCVALLCAVQILIKGTEMSLFFFMSF